MQRKTVGILVLAGLLRAQSVVPGNGGLVSYADEAYIGDRLVDEHFFRVTEGTSFRTATGRAEVLLGPCAAVWVDEKSAFRMISTDLDDIRLEVLGGSVMVAAGTMPRGTKLTIMLKTSAALIDRKGAYRMDAMPARLKVLAGRTTVQREDGTFPVNTDRWLSLDTPDGAHKFDKSDRDPFDTWSKGRAALLSRLAREKTEIPQKPAAPPTPADMDNVRTVVRSKSSPEHVPALPPPMPASSPSGCGVSPW